MTCGALPVRYLGVPLTSKKLNLSNCEPLLHQIKTRLSSWSVKTLSFSGRLLLIKTVIGGITTFWCSAFILPKACIARINSLCSVFLWKGNIDSHNTARVAWEKVVLTKNQGGLGIKDVHVWNKACCIKLIWLLFFRSGSIWVAWFTNVILKGSIHNYWTTKPSQSFSWLANKLLKLKDVVYPLIKQRLENGLTARFWFDSWTPFGNLSELLNFSATRLGIPVNATVASICRNGVWRIPPARTERHNFSFIPISHRLSSQATKTTMNGRLEERSILPIALEEVDWASVVWTPYGIPRHNFNTWLLVLNRAPTRDRMLSWGLQVSPLCLLCNAAAESRDHLFHQCQH